MINLILLCIVIIIGLLFPKSKYITCVIFLTVIYFIFLAKNNIDYKQYEINYSNLKDGFNLRFEVGFQLVNYILILFKFPFFSAYFIMTLSSVLLIYYGVKRITPNVNSSLSLYLIFPFIIDLIQTRNLIAMSILFLGFTFLIKDKKIIPFILLVLLSTTFHVSSLIYLVFIIIVFFDSKIILFLGFAVSIFTYFFTDKLLEIAGLLVDVSKLSYLQTKTSLLTTFFIVIFYVLFIFVINSFFRKKRENEYLNIKYENRVKKTNYMMIFFGGLLATNLTFTRMIRNTFLIQYTNIPVIMCKKNNKLHINYMSLLFVVILIFISIWWTFMIYENVPFEIFKF